MNSMNSGFKFALPGPITGASDAAQTALRLASIASRLALEDRTRVNHPTGRPENVAEHSNMLGIIIPALAEIYYPKLDANLIARFAHVHDIIEAYVGDTPTDEFSEQLFADKEALERRGHQQLKQDFQWITGFVGLVDRYEEQIEPEARCLRVGDKLMPLLVHFNDGGATLRTINTRDSLLRNSAERAALLRKDYPEFETFIALREELSELATTHLLSN